MLGNREWPLIDANTTIDTIGSCLSESENSVETVNLKFQISYSFGVMRRSPDALAAELATRWK